MLFPNIQVITQNKNVYFTDFKRNQENITWRYTHIKHYFNLNENDAAVIISQITSFDKAIIKFLKNNKIKNIYFFIDDIFRSNLGNSFCKDLNEFQEIKIVDRIIKKTKIKSYKIFHCEEIDFKILNYDINYADLFLYDFVKFCKDKKINFSRKFKYKISCFNNREDIHRQIISLLLCKEKDVFLTLNKTLNPKHVFNNFFFDIKKLDENITSKIRNNYEYLNNNYKNFLDPSIKNYDHLDFKTQNNDFLWNSIQDSFLNIITETSYTSYNINISEKTLKPITCYRPFVVLGTPGCLRKLKGLGFKTFSKWWDESYDDEQDHALRLQKIYYITKEILDKSNKELEEMLDEMKDVLIHNRSVLNGLEKHLVPKFI